MYPDIPWAERELKLAAAMNPGPWEDHSRNVALAAQRIAARCPEMNSEKAYVCGLLHDIGRRTGVAAVRHVIDGYDYAMGRGWDEVARICLTHSYPTQNIDEDIGRLDITDGQYRFIKDYLGRIEYDDYDRLIILCDALAEAGGFCILEKRFVDTTRRYGIYPFTVDRWNQTIAFRDHFETLTGMSVYSLLPGIEDCIYRK